MTEETTMTDRETRIREIEDRTEADEASINTYGASSPAFLAFDSSLRLNGPAYICQQDRAWLIEQLRSAEAENVRLRNLLTISGDPESVMVCMPNDPEFGNVCVVRRELFDGQITKIARLRALVKECGEALGPFAQYLPDGIRRVPDELIVSTGSPLARKQLYARDCYRAAATAARIREELSNDH